MATGEGARGLTVVTSFSPKGYEEYGKDFLRTFREFWPSNVQLKLYCDDYFYEEHTKLDAEDMPEWRYFYEGIVRFPLMCGETPNGYNIQFDARMARKTFIQADACNQFGGKVFWIDADVITHSPVPEGFLDEMLPDNKLCCFLGRDGWMYTESGFLGFNANHPYCEAFMNGYKRIFTQGYIFTQPAWHDCIAFDMARSASDPSWFKNLAEGCQHGEMHPFIHSPLAAYMDHRKGARKSSRTSPGELKAPRPEAYWNG
jgi:hypothetical protein